MGFKWSFLVLLLVGCSSVYPPKEEMVEVPRHEGVGPVHVAFVLGGGGAKGLALLGAMQELEAAGIKPDLIVGCSAGAVAGALYADGQDLSEVQKHFVSLKKADLLDFSYLRPLFGLIDGKNIQNLIRKTLRAQKFEELKTPLIVVATDLYSGDTIEISKGEIAKGVGASCAFPGFFKPVYLYGRTLVDGGVTAPVPVSVAKKHGAKKVIAIDVTGKLSDTAPRHLFGIGARSLDIAYRKLVELSLAEADVVIKMNFEDCGTFSDHQNEQLHEYGRKAAREMLPEIQKKLLE